ncbi:MAG: carboxylesterase family protein [Flavobacteriales bacterium]
MILILKKCSRYILGFSILLNTYPFFSQSSNQSKTEPKSIPAPSCPPCEIEGSKTDINLGAIPWPAFKGGDLLRINSLTPIKYEQPEGAYPNSYWNIAPWWMNKGVDPWSEYPFWGEDYIQPEHDFKSCVDDTLRWMCGYSYTVDIPKSYIKEKKYPLIIFLHGSIVSRAKSFVYRESTRTEFYKPESDPYIYVAPTKLEIDWDPNKIKDLIENIKENINIDGDRIYLTGLSMGGRGTFIVAAALPDTFAALMPLSVHHTPFNYLHLAKKVKDHPIWMFHGDIDKVSSYNNAKEMEAILLEKGANVRFRTEENTGHWGWNDIYNDPEVVNWLLSWRR